MRSLVACILFSSVIAVAQEGPVDPPSRVARLNFASGSVSMQPGGTEEWVPAVINRPLTTGDHLWADTDSRAELHIGSTAIRIDDRSALDILNLDDYTTQLRMPQGAMVIRLKYLDDNESIEIDTPQGSVSLLRVGEYRIDVRDDGQGTRVTTIQGEAEINGPRQAFTLHPHQTATIEGTDEVAYDIQGEVAPDGFTDWCMDRDRREDESVSARYVPPSMTGYEDLDAYGSWHDEPGYGAVWTPRAMPIGWAPYHNGHWVFVEPWGWTWVDDAPWGFAPFHYGRWAYIHGGWGWMPGTFVARPVYAPALVAFVGGAHWSLSVGVGAAPVAWFPLGPHEVYYPSYRVSPVYVRNVNVTHVNVTNINVTNVNVTNINYVNQRVPGAMTAVPANAFASARPVSQSAISISAQAAASARVAGTAPAVAPQVNSVLGSRAMVRASAPPPTVLSRQVIARSTPPPPPPAFAQRQQMYQSNPGRPLDPQTFQTMRQQSPSPQRAMVRTINAPPVQNTPMSRPAGRDVFRGGAVTPNNPAVSNTPANSRDSYRPFGTNPPPANQPSRDSNRTFGGNAPANNTPSRDVYRPPVTNAPQQNVPSRDVYRPPVTTPPPQNNAPSRDIYRPQVTTPPPQNNTPSRDVYRPPVNTPPQQNNAPSRDVYRPPARSEAPQVNDRSYRHIDQPTVRQSAPPREERPQRQERQIQREEKKDNKRDK